MRNVCTKMKTLYVRNIEVKVHPRTGHEGPDRLEV